MARELGAMFRAETDIAASSLLRLVLRMGARLWYVGCVAWWRNARFPKQLRSIARTSMRLSRTYFDIYSRVSVFWHVGAAAMRVQRGCKLRNRAIPSDHNATEGQFVTAHDERIGVFGTVQGSASAAQAR
ncbi:hypothetical protein ACFPTO_17700 [Paraburkholderia denitrificans]|uniref:Uncharacterized protein n=1 Tax=Paraburkholderia denitrificans TaxID=694025 RepID=A0ABW0JC59_9BURK